MKDTSPRITKSPWGLTEPGLWCRDADEIETWYAVMAKLYSGTGKSIFHITCHASLQLPFPNLDYVYGAGERLDKALQTAWLDLRRSHPCLSSTIEWYAETKSWRKQCYIPQSEQEEKAWLEETLKFVPGGITGEDLANSDLSVTNLPILLVTSPEDRRTHTCPSDDSSSVGSLSASSSSTSISSLAIMLRRDLVLRAPHDVLDGNGAFQTMQLLIANIARCYAQKLQPEASQAYNVEAMGLSFRDAADCGKTLNPDQLQVLAEGLNNPSPSSSANLISIPSTSNAMLPGRHQRAALMLNEECTRNLLEACRVVGITPTQAYHAAIALIMRDVQLRTIEQHYLNYTCFVLMDGRQDCVTHSTIDPSQYALGVYHSASVLPATLEVVVPRESDAHPTPAQKKYDFIHAVMQMKIAYHKATSNPDQLALAPLIKAARTPVLPDGWTEAPPSPSRLHKSIQM